MQNYNYPYYPSYPPQPTMQIDKVLNYEEAKKYQSYPNTIVYLLDQDKPYIYMKVCDREGRSTLRAFSLNEVDMSKIMDDKYINREDLNKFKEEIFKCIKDLKEDKK